MYSKSVCNYSKIQKINHNNTNNGNKNRATIITHSLYICKFTAKQLQSYIDTIQYSESQYTLFRFW